MKIRYKRIVLYITGDKFYAPSRDYSPSHLQFRRVRFPGTNAGSSLPWSTPQDW